MRSIWILVISITLGFIFFCGNEESLILDQVKKKLQSGNKKGTFHFIYIGKIETIDESKIPVQVRIKDSKDIFNVIARTNTYSNKMFKIEEDLKPGEYLLESKIIDVKFKKEYYDCLGPVITLSHEGIVEYSNTDIIHFKRIVIEKPKFLETVLFSEKLPKIKWKSIKKAKHYYIFWQEINEEDKVVNKGLFRNFKKSEIILDLKKKGEKIKNTKTSILFSITAYSETNRPFAEASITFYIQY